MKTKKEKRFWINGEYQSGIINYHDLADRILQLRFKESGCKNHEEFIELWFNRYKNLSGVVKETFFEDLAKELIGDAEYWDGQRKHKMNARNTRYTLYIIDKKLEDMHPEFLWTI